MIFLLFCNNMKNISESIDYIRKTYTIMLLKSPRFELKMNKDEMIRLTRLELGKIRGDLNYSNGKAFKYYADFRNGENVEEFKLHSKIGEYSYHAGVILYHAINYMHDQDETIILNMPIGSTLRETILEFAVDLVEKYKDCIRTKIEYSFDYVYSDNFEFEC